jgi:hypothetical protein
VNRFYSRSALIVAVSYAALIALLLIAAWHVFDLEGRRVDLLVIGLPWILMMSLIPGKSWFSDVLTIILNIATVYFSVLCLVRIFGDDSNGQL